MDNGTFVDNMLNDINRKYMDDEKLVQECIDSLRNEYANSKGLPRYPKRLKRQIDLRVKDLLDVIDPMWFVVALYHRNKGGLWRDMHKYGVKPNKCTWNIDKCDNYSRGGQTGFCEKHYKIWVLDTDGSSYKIEKASSVN